jgi:DNA-binding MarR family transcriptional regulator
VSRVREPADRRRHTITLTESGARHLVAAARAQHDADDALFAGLDGEQREQLRQLLLALRDTLDGAEGQVCDARATSCER